MKYFVLLLILIGFVTISSGSVAYGLWMPETPEGLFEQSQTVFVGTMTSVNVLEFERSNSYNAEENGVSRLIVENYTQSLDQYTVNIEEFLKNPQKLHTITMLEATVSGPGRSVSIGGFELGDRVLFYVPKLDGTNQYSPESFKIPKSCDAKDVVAQKRLQMGEEFTAKQDGIKVDYGNFTANKPIEFIYSKDMGTLDGKSFDVAVVISKYVDKNLKKPILNQEIHTDSKLCEWIASATWRFTPEKGDYTMSLLRKQDNATNYEYSGFSVKSDISNNLQSPLKQFKSGLQLDDIKCKESLTIVTRHGGSPACVKPETVPKLIQRGWVLPELKPESELASAKPGLEFKSQLTVEGLNQTYNVGEKIEFTIKSDGMWHGCGVPRLRIEDANHQQIWEGGLVVSLCDPDMKKDHIKKEWVVSDDSNLGVPVIDKEGFYTLFVTYGDDIIQKNFVVR